MADDPIKRLEQYGRRSAPSIDEGYADRLESHLRAEHASMTPNRRSALPALLPRLGLATVFIMAAVFGIIALQADDPVVPVAVVEGQTPGADTSVPAEGGGDEGDPVLAATTPTPTPTATPSPAPTALPLAVTPTPVIPVSDADAPTPTPDISQVQPTVTPLVVAPTATSTATVDSAPTVTPPPTVTPDAVVDPTPTAVAPATATPTVPTATSTPAPATSVPVSTPTATPTVAAAPTPTVEPEPVTIELLCRRRVVGDAVGVVCEWRAPTTDRIIAQYEVLRGRNGGDGIVVSVQRAGAPLQYADRDVEAGDTLAYLVRGLDADGQLVAASVREIVTAE